MLFFRSRKDSAHTDLELNAMRSSAQVFNAIKSSVAYIEFQPDGHVITANNLFLDALGYQLSDVQGKHHRLFCDSILTSSSDYQQFWRDLANGQPQTGTFRRLRKGGEEIWIEATYVPVKDENNKVIKVIKVASDVTEKKHRLDNQEAIFESLKKSMAYIEFTPKGKSSMPTITSAPVLAISFLRFEVSITTFFVAKISSTTIQTFGPH